MDCSLFLYPIKYITWSQNPFKFHPWISTSSCTKQWWCGSLCIKFNISDTHILRGDRFGFLASPAMIFSLWELHGVSSCICGILCIKFNMQTLTSEEFSLLCFEATEELSSCSSSYQMHHHIGSESALSINSQIILHRAWMMWKFMHQVQHLRYSHSQGSSFDFSYYAFLLPMRIALSQTQLMWKFIHQVQQVKYSHLQRSFVWYSCQLCCAFLPPIRLNHQEMCKFMHQVSQVRYSHQQKTSTQIPWK